MDDTYTAKPLSPLRKVIAARMAEASRTIPHFRVTTDIELDALMAVRPKMQSIEPDTKVSINDLLVKACGTALMDVPAVNAQWAETEIRQFHSADIAVVTAIEGGLSTPIIRRADTKSVWEIAREVKELTARAARNALKLSEISGGSFSISNLGTHGVDEFDAIINPPQCAILAVGRAKPGYTFSEDRRPRIAMMLRATLSIDHRALDGAAGAAFLRALKHRIEEPSHLLGDRR